jgi:hypothetical protein
MYLRITPRAGYTQDRALNNIGSSILSSLYSYELVSRYVLETNHMHLVMDINPGMSIGFYR